MENINKKNNVKENKFKKYIFKNIVEFLKFYKVELRKTHIISYIISLIIFGLTVGALLTSSSTMDFTNIGTEISRINLIGEKTLIILLTIFSGVAPFFFIPIIGILLLPFNIAVNMFDSNILVTTFMSAFVIVQLFFTSLAVAAGIYYCRCSTKRYRYDHSTNYGIDDLKSQLLEISKNEKKIEAFRDKRIKKMEKREKLNIKIRYKMLLVSFIISIIPIIIISFIIGV